LGVTCIHLLTGVEPFELFDTDEGEWVWRNYLKSKVSNELGQILDKMIESGRKKRYQSATELLQALQPNVPNSLPNPSTPSHESTVSIPLKSERPPQPYRLKSERPPQPYPLKSERPPQPYPLKSERPFQPPPPKVKLISAVGVDYTQLQNLLADGKWEDADSETFRVILKAAKQKGTYLDKDLIGNLPCDDLGTINQLWLNYSNGHFGFSVQKQIWLECGGKIDYATEEKLGDRLGLFVNNKWFDPSSIIYSIDAPPGHLPARWVWEVRGGSFWVVGWFSSLASRAAICAL